VTGGQLLISTIDGDLVQEGGELVAGQAMTITGDWTLGADAGFLLEGPQGQVTVEGDVVLAGQLRLQNGSVGNGEAVVVVDAASIDLATTDIDLDQAWELSLESGGLGQRLVLLPPAGLGADTDSDTGDDTVGTDTDSCGCAAPAPTLAWLWLLAPWWHRRR
jgi:hypothetical protein